MTVYFEKIDAKYKGTIEQALGVTLDNETFEAVGWMYEEWYDEIENGPPEHQELLRKIRVINAKYIAYLLKDDIDRAWGGNPYPRPVTDRLRKVWDAAKTLYFLDDPAGFLGPSDGEMIYVARAIVLAHDLGNTDFDDELVGKLNNASIWPVGKPKDEDFYDWLATDEWFYMFEFRGPKEENPYVQDR